MVTKQRARVTGMAVLALTFVIGTLVGAATLQVVAGDEPPAVRPAPGRDHEQQFFEQLGLTAEQRSQIEVILERRRVEMDKYRPLLRAIGDSARAEIRAVLTTEQRLKEEQYRAQRRAAFEQREKERKANGKQ